MIPKYCPNCGSLLNSGNNRYIRDELYYGCSSCELLFQIFSEEDLIQMHNERIKGPCSYCGGDHWKPDCKKYQLANIPGFPGLDKINIPGVTLLEEIKFDKPQSQDVKCESCGYEGNIASFPPAMSVYHDIICPKCRSTNNKHNSEYTNNLLKKMGEVNALRDS